MKIALYVIGAIVGLWILWLIFKPRPAVVYPTAGYGSGGTWANVGRLLGFTIGGVAASYAQTPRPATGSPGYGPASIAWQPNPAQLAASYNSITPGDIYGGSIIQTPGTGGSTITDKLAGIGSAGGAVASGGFYETDGDYTLKSKLFG